MFEGGRGQRKGERWWMAKGGGDGGGSGSGEGGEREAENRGGAKMTLERIRRGREAVEGQWSAGHRRGRRRGCSSGEGVLWFLGKKDEKWQ